MGTMLRLMIIKVELKENAKETDKMYLLHFHALEHINKHKKRCTQLATIFIT